MFDANSVISGSVLKSVPDLNSMESQRRAYLGHRTSQPPLFNYAQPSRQKTGDMTYLGHSKEMEGGDHPLNA